MPTPLYIKYHESHYGGDKIDPDDQWSERTDEDIQFHIISVHTQELDGFDVERVEVDFDPYAVKVVHIVIVRYSSGDTFGHESGHWNLPLVTDDVEKAHKIAQQIEDGNYKQGKGRLPWVGHFESLECVEVRSFVIT